MLNLIGLYQFKVKTVKAVVDGDTVDLTIDLGFYLEKTDRFRLARYDAPETWRPKNIEEKHAGIKVKDYIISLVEKYKDNLYVATQKGTDIYGRYLGELYTKQEGGAVLSINDMIIQYMIDNKLRKDDLNVTK